jgi:hypothetical protein
MSGAPARAAGAPGAPVRAAIALFTTTAVLACAGAVLAVHGLVAGDDHPGAAAVQEAPDSRAWTAPVSYGTLAVERVERSPATRAGMTHDGIRARADEVAIVLALRNRGSRAVPYAPGQFRLRLDRTGATLPPLRPNPPPGAIPAGKTLRQRIAFVVPRARTRLTLLFDDLAAVRPPAIGLGSLPADR